MTGQKIIAVVGATGAQGGGLVRAISADVDGPFKARAITRHPDSAKAREIAALGVEVVKGDLGDAASLERAFAGAHGAYCVTFYWEHFSPERETAEARSMATAAKRAGIRHAIWSTFEDSRDYVPLEDARMPTLMERYKVPHFDAKAEANPAFVESDVPTTFLLTSFYWDNLIHFGMGPRRMEDGSLGFMLPMGDRKLPGIAAEDIGRCAHGIFKAGAELAGRTVGVAGEHLTGEEMASSIGKAIGQHVQYVSVPFDTYRGLGFPGADDLGNMFQFKHDFQEVYCGNRDVEFSRRMNPALQTFDAWLASNANRIPIG